MFMEAEPMEAEQEAAGICIEIAYAMPGKQIILNLMRNAIDSMTEDGCNEPVLTVRTSPAGSDAVAVEVSDTGPGVSPENVEKIFDAFVSTKSGGMGMGLSICRSLIESHGGLIWAENAPEGGARVCFTLPVADGLHNNNGSERGRSPRV